MGSRAQLSAIDTLMMTLMPAPTWLSTKGKVNKRSKGPDRTRPTSVANNIDGAFNCVIHSWLINIMFHYKLPADLVGTIGSFTQARTISMNFEGKREPPAPFTSGLPQSSPLSPGLFILYASALSAGSMGTNKSETYYIDNKIMHQGATSTTIACRPLQRRLDQKLERPSYLNIRLAPSKIEMMHLIPLTSKHKPNESTEAIKLCDQAILPSNTIRSLGVPFDHRLSIHAQAAATGAKTRSLVSLLAKVSKRKGASLVALHNLVPTAIISRHAVGIGGMVDWDTS